MSGSKPSDKSASFRNRSGPIKRWLRCEETALINFLKKHRDFEKPVARAYYNTFLAEYGMEGDFKIVRSKVRNMRTAYRKAKEYEINKGKSSDIDLNDESMKRQMLRMCWYLDDFDDIFPNEMDGYIDKSIQMPTFEDDISNQEELFANTKTNATFNEEFTEKDELSSSSSSQSLDGSLFSVQKNLLVLKSQKRNKDTSIRQQEINLFKEQINFEKEKFKQEIKLKEKEIESQERLKVMELEIKERIAMKELELKEELEIKSMQKQETNYNNVNHANT